MLLFLIYFIVLLLLFCGIYSRLTCGICTSSSCLIGKVAIVTGGNAGIGYQVCKNLASRGCKVIIADRDDSTDSRNEIISDTGNPNIVSKFLDLGSFKSIRQFANDIMENEERLDILINNAGIGAGPKNLTEDGLHYIYQVNYCGPFLLTHLLLDILRKSAPSRIVFTSSVLSAFHNLTSDNMKNQIYQNSCNTTLKLYSITKAATILATEVLAEKLKNDKILVNSVHPGIVTTAIYTHTANVNSDFGSYITGYLAYFLTYIVGKNAWEGAQTTVHVAIAKELENTTGEFFWDCRVFPKIRCKWTTVFKDQIWRLSERLAQLDESEKI